eukprot:Phypoly_transcript_04048.p1 GENE.Phypoly_transcript_04048~~Phypoly_transcript_04048.p1  ORF type:complete len:725 (+),score=123.49 Phypoly_transcript_04048:64-2175(+)
MSSDVSTELHCTYDTKIKVRPGSTVTLDNELQVPSGVYLVYIEHERKDSSLRKSHSNIAASGDLLIAAGKEPASEILKSDIDFHREHPFLREIRIPEVVIEDGANEKEDNPTIKMLLTITSTAHIKKIRLRIKILTQNENAQTQIISSNVTEKRKNGRIRTLASSVPSPDFGSDRSTPTSSFSDLPAISVANLDVPSVLAGSGVTAREEEEIDPPRTEKQEKSDKNEKQEKDKHEKHEKHNIDVVEKDVVVIQKNTTYSSEGVEQNNTTQIRVEHTKTVTESTETTVNPNSNPPPTPNSDKRPLEKSSDFETNTTNSTSSFDASEENLVYYKDIQLRKKHVHTEKIPIQQKGKYYLVIENTDKGPITRHFSCHAILSHGDILLKESFTNDAKKKLSDDFTVDAESADLTLKIAHINSSFGKSELQVSLYMKNATTEETVSKIVHPHLRTGEVVWSVTACEVEKKHPQKFSAKIPTSGKYYIVAEKVDKIYGGLREIAVDATLTEPPGREGETGRMSKVASVVVGGVKARPMKWKSPIFAAPAGSVVDFNVVSYAIVGSIVYSLRLRKVPGLTAEEERTRQMVLLFLMTFGIYYLLYMILSILHFVQNIGFTLNILFLSIDITVGRICFVLCAVWCKTNQEILVPCMKDVKETVRKILRKIKHFRDMSDGGKFDILRIFKQMSKEGKLNDLRKWERQKLQTANE